MRAALRLGLLALAFALATSGFGWWTVPVLGAVWGVVDSGGAGGARGSRGAAATAALAAMLAWGALLLGSALGAPVGALAGKLGAIVGVSPLALYAATLLLPAVLAGSAAAMTHAARGR